MTLEFEPFIPEKRHLPYIKAPYSRTEREERIEKHQLWMKSEREKDKRKSMADYK